MNVVKSRFMRHMTNPPISPSLRRVFPKVRTYLAQELMRSHKLDTNKDVVGWGVVVSGVGWKDGEVTGQRFQWCRCKELPGELIQVPPNL